MAGRRGNVAWMSLDIQSGKGVPVAVPTNKLPFAGGNILPRNERGELSETDASRDQGDTYAQQGGVEGSPSAYARDPYMPAVLQAALGARVDTPGTHAAGVDYEAALTAANSIPYVTLHKMLDDYLYERFEDVLVNELTLRAEAGQPLTWEIGVLGRKATRLLTDPAPLVDVAQEDVYNFNEVAVTFNGGPTSLVSSMELTYGNGVSLQQTDDYIPYDVVAGQRSVTVGFNMIFENYDHYNEFHYGASNGVNQVGSVFETDVSFTYTKGAANEIALVLDAITVEEYPVEPDPGGEPIVVPVRARAKRSGSPVLAATVKTQGV